MKDALHLLPTARHVDEARIAGFRAQTVPSFVRDALVLGAPDIHLAPSEVVRLATTIAAKDVLATARKRVVHPTHLGAVLDRSLSLLRRAGVQERDLRRTGTTRGALLADVLAHVNRQLERLGLVDRDDAPWVLAQHAEALAAVSDGPVTIGAKLGFDQNELAWVKALDAHPHGGVTLALPSGSVIGDNDAFLPVEQRLLQLLQDPDRAPLFHHEPVSPSSNVRILRAADPASEARAIAWEVADTLAQGIAPERIAVVLIAPDETLLEPLRLAFERAQIAFSESQDRPPFASTAAVGALSLLALGSSSIHRTTLQDLLSNASIDPRLWTGSSHRSQAQEAALHLARALGELPISHDSSGDAFLNALRAFPPSRQRALRGSSTALLQTMLSDLRSLGAEPTRRSVLLHFQTMVHKLGLASPSLDSLQGALSSKESAFALAHLAQEARSMRSLLRGASDLLRAATLLGIADQPSDIATVVAELGATTGPPAPRDSAPAAGAVVWVSACDIVDLPFDFVVIAGASAANEHSAHSFETLLDDETIDALPSSQRPLTRGDLAQLRRAELNWVLAKAQNTLVTFSTTDVSGRSTVPAQIVRSLLEAGVVPSNEPLSRVAPSSRILGARAGLLRELAHELAPVPEPIRRYVEMEQAREHFFMDPSAIATPWDGNACVSAAHLTTLLGGDADRPLSITTLEAAAQCRFLAYVRYVLRASREHEIDEVGDAREVGTLTHEALAAAFGTLQEGHHQAPRATVRARALRAAEQTLVVQQHAGTLRHYALRTLRRAVEIAIDHYLDEASEFQFHLAEKEFGGKDTASWPPLVIEDQDGRVHLRGRIDRIDWSPKNHCVRAVDYKTGSLSFPMSDWGVRLFQPVFYAEAAALNLTALERHGGYLRLRGQALWKPPTAKQRIDEATLALAKENALTLVRKLHTGDFAPRPADATLCVHCEARDICRRPAFAPAPLGDDTADE